MGEVPAGTIQSAGVDSAKWLTFSTRSVALHSLLSVICVHVWQSSLPTQVLLYLDLSNSNLRFLLTTGSGCFWELWLITSCFSARSRLFALMHHALFLCLTKTPWQLVYYLLWYFFMVEWVDFWKSLTSSKLLAEVFQDKSVFVLGFFYMASSYCCLKYW